MKTAMMKLLTVDIILDSEIKGDSESSDLDIQIGGKNCHKITL